MLNFVKSTTYHTIFLGIFSIPVIVIAEPVYLFLLGGQSNMSGMTGSGNLSSELKSKQQNTRIYLNPSMDGATSLKGKWLTLEPGFGYSNTQFGPELCFAASLTKKYPAIKFALYKSSVAGTNLDKQWRPPSSGGTAGNLYTSFVSELQKAITSLKNATTDTIIIKGMLWMQGESDAMDKSMANNYEKNLKNLINDIRKEVTVDDMPFIAANIDEQTMWTDYKIVNTAMNNLAKEMTNVITFPTKGFKTDRIHYQNEGMVALGNAFADATIDGKFLENTVRIVSGNFFKGYSRTLENNSPLIPEIYDLSGRKIKGVTIYTNSLHVLIRKNGANGSYRVPSVGNNQNQ
ncbi:MAG: hypothetical protein JW915_14210 [Chitinispirillaceae bacterium]|nr:hypothetical protein [Chitinispirillaceae bacterium]